MQRVIRISRLSGFLRLISAAAVCFFAALAVAAFLIPVHVMGPWYGPPSPEAFASRVEYEEPRLVLNVGSKTPEFRYANVFMEAPKVQRQNVARAAAALYMVYLALGAALFFRVFGSFEKLRIFETESVRALKQTGLWMIGLWFAGFAFQFAKGAFLNNHGFDIDLGAGLLPGLFVLLIAWVIEEANRLAEEQALTV